MKSKRGVPTNVECYHCPHNKGLDVLQLYTVKKSDSGIIGLKEVAVYNCEFFGLVHEEDECINISPHKEITNNDIQWVEQ